VRPAGGTYEFREKRHHNAVFSPPPFPFLASARASIADDRPTRLTPHPL